MKALSVKQPWSELLASGRKTVEVRSWQTDYRGPLLNVASSQPNWYAAERFNMLNLPCGVAVSVGDLTRIVRFGDVTRDARRQIERNACCELGPDDFAWYWENHRRVRPFAVKGRLRLYDVPGDLVTLACAHTLQGKGCSLIADHSGPHMWL